jgi:hypothetical protein
MKTKYFTKVIKSGTICAAVVVLTVLNACNFLMGPDTPGKDGNVTLSIEGGNSSARAITSGADLPGDVLDAMRYELVLTGPDGETRTETITGGQSLRLSLPLGDWRVDARAYQADSPNLAGTGSTSFTVRPGTNSVTLPMQMQGTDGTPLTCYNITLIQGSNGTVTANFPAAFAGTTVTLTAVPDSNWQIVSSGFSTTPTVTVSGSGTSYTFTMPASDLTITPTFTTTYTVSGTIRTDLPDAPANGAAVQLKQGAINVGSAVLTDSSGAYTISGVSTGTYTIEVSLSGYTTGTIASFTVSGNVSGKNLTLRKYAIGDTGPGGGKIFYIDTADTYPDWIYLECAPSDSYASATNWGALYTSVSTGNAIGDGPANTTAIMNADSDSTIAARLARNNSNFGGYTDWFLPSGSEMHQLYLRRASLNLSSTSYWTSSGDSDDVSAYYYDFGTGNYTWGNRNSVSRVRAIRRF